MDEKGLDGLVPWVILEKVAWYKGQYSGNATDLIQSIDYVLL